MNAQHIKPKWYNSSVNPLALSLAIRGALVMHVPFVIAMAAAFGVPLTDTVVVDIITMTAFAAGALMLLYGLFRRGYIYLKDNDYI